MVRCSQEGLGAATGAAAMVTAAASAPASPAPLQPQPRMPCLCAQLPVETQRAVYRELLGSLLQGERFALPLLPLPQLDEQLQLFYDEVVLPRHQLPLESQPAEALSPLQQALRAGLPTMPPVAEALTTLQKARQEAAQAHESAGAALAAADPPGLLSAMQACDAPAPALWVQQPAAVVASADPGGVHACKRRKVDAQVGGKSKQEIDICTHVIQVWWQAFVT